MSELDRLLDDFRALADAARALEQSRGHHEGEHELCCEKGRCLKCEDARIQAEGNLHEVLLKVEPKPFHPRSNQRLPPQPEMQSKPVPVPEENVKKLGN